MGMLDDVKSFLGVIFALLQGREPEAKDAFELLYSVTTDPWHCETSEYENEKFAATLKMMKKKYKRILEVGCSEGVFTRMMAKYAKSILAVDISPTAVERASQRNMDIPLINFQVLDIEKGKPPGKFDMIVCSEVLYYFNDVERIRAAGERFVDILEPGGQILLANMRRLSDDESGFPPPKLGYPLMGAATVHGVFDEIASIRKIDELQYELYTISLYEKIN